MKALISTILLVSLLACSEEQESVMSKFDETNPQASLDAIDAGQTDSFLEFSKEKEDLGDVFQNQEIPLEFPFEVKGNSPLVITAIETSCGCTDAEIEVNGKAYVLKDEIPAGSKGAIRGVFKSAQYSNNKASKITVKGNGAKMPRILQVDAFIHPIFELTPKEVRFGDVPSFVFKNETPSQEILVVAAKEFEITKWLKMPDGIKVEDTGRKQMHEDGERQMRWFKVSIGSAIGNGHIYQSAIAETSLERNLEFVVQVNIFGPVRYDPEQRLTFGLMDVGQSRSRRINVRTSLPDLNLPTPTLEVIGADLFKPEIVEKEAGKFYVFKVHVGADAPVGHHNAVLRCSWPEEAGLEPKEWNLKAIVRERK